MTGFSRKAIRAHLSRKGQNVHSVPGVRHQSYCCKKQNQIYPPLMLLWGWSKENPRGLPLDHMDHNWQSRNYPSYLFCPFVHGVLQHPWQEDREMLKTVGTHSLLAWSAATDGVSGLVWWSQKGPLLCIFTSKWDFLWQRGRPTNFCKLTTLVS